MFAFHKSKCMAFGYSTVNYSLWFHDSSCEKIRQTSFYDWTFRMSRFVIQFHPIVLSYSFLLFKKRGKSQYFFKRKKIHFREGVSPSWIFLYISDGGENLKYERFVRLTAETWILWYVHGVSDISITPTGLNFIDYFSNTQQIHRTIYALALLWNGKSLLMVFFEIIIRNLFLPDYR